MRDPYDGKPYYCSVCGVGYDEYTTCGEGGCRLETEASAASRAQKRRKLTSDADHFKPKD